MADRAVGTRFFRRGVAGAVAGGRHLSPGDRARRIATEDLTPADGIGATTIDPLLARLVLACWQRFFTCFRRDELALEFPRYQAEAEQVVSSLAGLGDDQLPDLRTCQKMLFLLSRFDRERFRELNERIEDLSEQGRAMQRRVEELSMDGAFSADQLGMLETVLRQGYEALGFGPPEDEDEEASRDEPPSAQRLLTELVRNMERDRCMLRRIATSLDPRTFSQLPIEAQVYLTFFRDS